jgi:hypothetical protein
MNPKEKNAYILVTKYVIIVEMTLFLYMGTVFYYWIFNYFSL